MWTVLIVDDDRSITKLLDYAFGQAGFSVMIARDGNEGFAMASEHPPDAAILDVMMPGYHGYELCRRLRADPRLSHTKIVFLTARSQAIDEQEGIKAGGDLFLSKPVMPDELVDTVKSLLARQAKEPSVAAELGPEAEGAAQELDQGAEQPAATTLPAEPALTQGRLIVCLGGSEGVGVTTVTANLSIALALSRRAQTPVVELHSEPRDLLPAFGLASGVPYGDLKATGSTLNWDTLPLHLMDHSTGVRVLPAPPPGSDVTPALTNRAVFLLRTRFPVVLADAASEFDERVQTVVLASDLVLLVLTPELTSIRATWQVVQRLRQLDYPQRQILLVVNHCQSQPGVPQERVQEALPFPVLAVVPHEPAMATMFEIGKPLILAEPSCPASLTIGRMAMQLGRGLD